MINDSAPISQLSEVLIQLESSLQSENDGLSSLVNQANACLNEIRADSKYRTKADILRELTSTRSELAKLKSKEKGGNNLISMFGKVFEKLQEGVVITNHLGQILEANPKFVGLLGIEQDKLLQSNIGTLVSWPKPFRTIYHEASHGTDWEGNVEITDRDCSLWASISSTDTNGMRDGHAICIFSDVTQLETAKQELHRQTLHDHLTSLPNRKYFREQISKAIQDDCDGSNRFIVCFMDLDDFKIVNDTLGHDYGDRLLVEVSERINSAFGYECFLARFGGDEFALLVTECDSRSSDYAQTIVDIISQPFQLGEHEVHVGISVGTTSYPDDGLDVETLMRQADLAMYRAKEEGKNKVRFYTPELIEVIETRQEMLTQLRRAITEKQLSVVYQPKIELQTGVVAGCEALIRWEQPNGKKISPSEFIPLAEDSGLIGKIGEFMLQTVCCQANQWQAKGCNFGPIAINISPRQLKDQSFLYKLNKVITDTGTDPSWIEMEITENAVMEDLERSLELMREICELGIPIAIDDFGTGYSSLSYIKDFPISILKIDTSFVVDLPHDQRSTAIAKTILSLGHGLSLKVVAEGVENEHQLEFLRSVRCDQVQGYLFSRPMSAEEFEFWIPPRLQVRS